MSIHTSLVDELPVQVRKSARQSVCQDIVALAIAEAPKYVQATADTNEDLTRFYKSLIQYKKRHTELVINLRKYRDALYVWVVRSEDQAA